MARPPAKSSRTTNPGSTTASSHTIEQQTRLPDTVSLADDEHITMPVNSKKYHDAIATELDDLASRTLIRRILCPHKSVAQTSEPTFVADILPPLTSSNDVDLQLYTFIAILIKKFVNPWYSKVTSDHAFVDDVLLIIAHCTRALEERMRKLNWEAILLDELPQLFDAHITACRTADSAIREDDSESTEAAIARRRRIYHALRPHPALSPVPEEGEPFLTQQEREENDLFYRQILAQGILAVLLPTDDLQNPCLFALVTGVLADLVLGEFIGERLCEGKFLYEMIERVAETAQKRFQTETWAFDENLTEPPQNRLVQLGLVQQPGLKTKQQANATKNSKVQLFWTAIHYMVLGYAMLCFCISGLLAYSTLPPRTKASSSDEMPRLFDEFKSTTTVTDTSNPTKTQPPMTKYRIWQVAQHILFFDSRMPWLAGLKSYIHHILIEGPGRLGRTDGRIDRFLAYHILQPLRTPTVYIPSCLRILRAALFPQNSINVAGRSAAAPHGSVLASTGPPPLLNMQVPAQGPEAHVKKEGMEQGEDDDEGGSSINHDAVIAAAAAASAAVREKAKRRAAIALLNVFPHALVKMYLLPARPLSNLFPFLFSRADSSEADSSHDGASKESETEEAEKQELEAMIAEVQRMLLDVFEDEYLNRHLVYVVMEYLLGKIIPELHRDASGGSSGGGGSGGSGGGGKWGNTATASVVSELLAERGVI